MNVKVVERAGEVERTLEQDQEIIQRYFARKICGSLATGALMPGAWPNPQLMPTKMALLRLESILIYNLLDRGTRILPNGFQGVAIEIFIQWHVNAYGIIYADALQFANAAGQVGWFPTPAEYETSLNRMIQYRLSVYGVKTAATTGPTDITTLRQATLRQAACAAWITNALFLDTCMREQNGITELYEVDVVGVANAPVNRILNAWTAINNMDDGADDASDGANCTNEQIRAAACAVLQNFHPPQPPLVPVIENTFLAAGTTRGDLFRFCCSCIMVISHICHTGIEPNIAAARTMWLDFKHFNFLANHIAVVAAANPHHYVANDTFEENVYCSRGPATWFAAAAV